MRPAQTWVPVAGGCATQGRRHRWPPAEGWAGQACSHPALRLWPDEALAGAPEAALHVALLPLLGPALVGGVELELDMLRAGEGRRWGRKSGRVSREGVAVPARGAQYSHATVQWMAPACPALARNAAMQAAGGLVRTSRRRLQARLASVLPQLHSCLQQPLSAK